MPVEWFVLAVVLWHLSELELDDEEVLDFCGGFHHIAILVEGDHSQQEDELVEEESWLSRGGLTVRSFRVHIFFVDFDQHAVLHEVLILLIRHRSDSLSDQLVQRLDVQRVWDQLLEATHLEERRYFHRFVQVLNVSLSENLVVKST